MYEGKEQEKRFESLIKIFPMKQHLRSLFAVTFNLDFCGENVCVKYVRAINNNLINIGNSCSICLSIESLQVTFSSSQSVEGKRFTLSHHETTNWHKLISTSRWIAGKCLFLLDCQFICGGDCFYLQTMKLLSSHVSLRQSNRSMLASSLELQLSRLKVLSKFKSNSIWNSISTFHSNPSENSTSKNISNHSTRIIEQFSYLMRHDCSFYDFHVFQSW